MNIKNHTRSLPSLDIVSPNDSKNYISKRSFISYCTREGEIFSSGISFTYLRIPLNVDTTSQTGKEGYEHPTYVEVKGSYIESLLTSAGNHPINFTFTHNVMLPYEIFNSSDVQETLIGNVTIDQEFTNSTTDEIPTEQLINSYNALDWACTYNTYFKAIEFYAPLKNDQNVTIKGIYLLM